MPYMPNYKCTRCDTPQKRDLLTVKKVSFLEMGTGGRVVRSRVTHWLCPSCVSKDEDFNREPFKAPGSERIPDPAEKEKLGA